MFGGEKGQPVPAGAREKHRRAQMLHGDKKAKGYEPIQARRGGGDQATSWVVSVAIIFVVAIGLAWLLTDTFWSHGGAPFGIGIDSIDRNILQTSSAYFFGDATFDPILLVFFRGLLFFVMGGIIPGAAFLWVRLIDRTEMNPYLTVWGVTIALVLIASAYVLFVKPAIDDLLR